MPNSLQIKRSAVAGRVPTSLVAGELALNRADKELYYLDATNSIVSLLAIDCGVISASGLPWTPAAIGSGLALWFDANDASTITLNGSTVSQWNDKSGNGRNATQATAANQPTRTLNGLNGKTVITFDGANDFLDHPLSLAGSSTIYAVANKTSVGTDAQAIIGISASGQPVDNAMWARVPAIDQWGVYTTAFDSSGQTLGTSYRILGSVSNNPPTGAFNLYTDGALSASSTGGRWNGSDNNNRRRIGSEHPSSTRFLPGNITEIVVTSTALSTADCQRLEGYLAHKWGLQANLPSNHPFKNSAPTM